ncbi:hypothetical protein F4820DRAFT_448877 [Hypoxylon rubiginosum]|uniref:Uncharacterized protein n=1 Tax=Hypoxylon rubiginosum TaxID=110542 RepID=A0ACB9Z027_9PEZI|nr:hypothetical protein F4820DRAFT_448877 [Hypoxylon rubiginosum]
MAPDQAQEAKATKEKEVPKKEDAKEQGVEELDVGEILAQADKYKVGMKEHSEQIDQHVKIVEKLERLHGSLEQTVLSPCASVVNCLQNCLDEMKRLADTLRDVRLDAGALVYEAAVAADDSTCPPFPLRVSLPPKDLAHLTKEVISSISDPHSDSHSDPNSDPHSDELYFGSFDDTEEYDPFDGFTGWVKPSPVDYLMLRLKDQPGLLDSPFPPEMTLCSDPDEVKRMISETVTRLGAPMPGDPAYAGASKEWKERAEAADQGQQTKPEIFEQRMKALIAAEKHQKEYREFTHWEEEARAAAAKERQAKSARFTAWKSSELADWIDELNAMTEEDPDGVRERALAYLKFMENGP